MTKYQEYPEGQPKPRGLKTITREKRGLHIRNAQLAASALDVAEYEQEQDKRVLAEAMLEAAEPVTLSKIKGTAPVRQRTRKEKDSIIISVPEERLHEALPVLRSLEKHKDIQAPRHDFLRSSKMKADEHGVVHIAVLGFVTESMVARLNDVGASIAEDDSNHAGKVLKGQRRSGHLSQTHSVISHAAHDLVVEAQLSPEKAASLFSAKRGNQIVRQIRDWQDAPEAVSVQSFDLEA